MASKYCKPSKVAIRSTQFIAAMADEKKTVREAAISADTDAQSGLE